MPVVLLLLVATLLRIYRLDQQIWHDEISILVTSLHRPLLEIATQWPGPASHVLFELAARLSIELFGVNPVAMRLPAVLFGIAGVAAFYWLASSLFRSAHAFALSALYAVSYHHVWFSQNARGYTAIMLFFVLATAQVIRFWQRGRIGRWDGLAYAVTGALVAYSHPVGMSVVPVHGLVVLAAVLLARRSGEKREFPLVSYLRYAALSVAVTALLYLPFVPSIVTFTSDIAEAPASGPRAGAGLLRVVIEGLSAAFFGPFGLAVAVLIGLVGLVAWYRHSPFALAVLVLPVVAQGATFVVLGIGINPRYFAVALPGVLLIGGYGVILVLRALVERLPASPARRRQLEYGLLAAVVLLSALPLARYYQYPKQDYLGAMRAIDERAADGDIRGGVYIAGHALNDYYNAGYTPIETLADLQALETQGRRIWLVSTLERVVHAHDPALLAHIKQHYRLVTVLPGTLGDGEMRIYSSDSAGL